MRFIDFPSWPPVAVVVAALALFLIGVGIGYVAAPVAFDYCVEPGAAPEYDTSFVVGGPR